MWVSTILDHVDSGDRALPKFQRGYVWNRDQVRALMDSLYRRHPVGSLLVWATAADGGPCRYRAGRAGNFRPRRASRCPPPASFTWLTGGES